MSVCSLCHLVVLQQGVCSHCDRDCKEPHCRYCEEGRT